MEKSIILKNIRHFNLTIPGFKEKDYSLEENKELAKEKAMWLRQNLLAQIPKDPNHGILLYPSHIEFTTISWIISISNVTYISSEDVRALGGLDSTLLKQWEGMKRFLRRNHWEGTENETCFLNVKQQPRMEVLFAMATDERVKPESVTKELWDWDKAIQKGERCYRDSYDPTRRCKYDKGQNFDWVLSGTIYANPKAKSYMLLENKKYKIDTSKFE